VTIPAKRRRKSWKNEPKSPEICGFPGFCPVCGPAGQRRGHPLNLQEKSCKKCFLFRKECVILGIDISCSPSAGKSIWNLPAERAGFCYVPKNIY
jgi:hypothetical protein